MCLYLQAKDVAFLKRVFKKVLSFSNAEMDKFSTALLYKKRGFPVNTVNVNFIRTGDRWNIALWSTSTSLT